MDLSEQSLAELFKEHMKKSLKKISNGILAETTKMFHSDISLKTLEKILKKSKKEALE